MIDIKTAKQTDIFIFLIAYHSIEICLFKTELEQLFNLVFMFLLCIV